MAKACHVEKFIVLSTTDVYGENLGKITVNSQMNSETDYAKSKLNGERKIAELNDDNFKISILRIPVVEGTKRGFVNHICFAKKNKISMKRLLEKVESVLNSNFSGIKVITSEKGIGVAL
ncbi:NAD-dependent epimerase/dehydratase family protein [Anaerostipes faecalis]|uniref:NAD-dependent epimerase/dehydratase family protein n=1 Tax=Anaerostipes faecalis TaxID=2738446 RepID=UPI003F08A9DF